MKHSNNNPEIARSSFNLDTRVNRRDKNPVFLNCLVCGRLMKKEREKLISIITFQLRNLIFLIEKKKSQVSSSLKKDNIAPLLPQNVTVICW